MSHRNSGQDRTFALVNKLRVCATASKTLSVVLSCVGSSVSVAVGDAVAVFVGRSVGVSVSVGSGVVVDVRVAVGVSVTEGIVGSAVSVTSGVVVPSGDIPMPLQRHGYVHQQRLASEYRLGQSG